MRVPSGEFAGPGKTSAGAIIRSLILIGLWMALSATAQITKFSSPTPKQWGGFGYSLAPVGDDRVLVSAFLRFVPPISTNNEGVGYLFSTNGILLTTFANPAPEKQLYFGLTTAALGSNLVAIGAPIAGPSAFQGEVYLFATDGSLVRTLTNPSPPSINTIGANVVNLGTDRLLVSADGVTINGITNLGASLLFQTNGALLAMFTNPVPVSGDRFGETAAVVGGDRILIGAPGVGFAYLFDTNGMLLTTFTNPTLNSADLFGVSVAAVGVDRILIGGGFVSSPVFFSGAAYLFDTNGVLLRTFTNSMPVWTDFFGYKVAGVDSERLLVSAYNLGKAYLFHTDGTLLATFSNPALNLGDSFGESLAIMGSDRVLIGSRTDTELGIRAGTAFLFALPALEPKLRIASVAEHGVNISWSPAATGFFLQEALSLTSPQWSNAPSGSTNPVIVPALPNEKYYRLMKP